MRNTSLRFLIFMLLSCGFTNLLPGQQLKKLAPGEKAVARRKVLEKTNVDTLKTLANKFEEAHRLEMQRALEIARRESRPVRYTGRNGKIYVLSGLDAAGQLEYTVTDNLDAAITTSTNTVWSGGAAGLSLDGSGLAIGLWEAGGIPLANHQEFAGRVIVAPGQGSTLSDHASHVCGTLIAEGIDEDAHGMANAALVVAFDANNDVTEMANEAADGLLISNHSYGTLSGWDYGDDNQWYWYGNTSVSTVEDYKFGLYDAKTRQLDQIAVNAPYYLVVKSAGNDHNDNHSGTHKVMQNNQWVTSSAYRDPDGGADGYDCIPTYGTAKNILTVGAISDIPGGYGTPDDVEIAAFSGWGPTDDGRIKPDLVGNGVDVYSCLSSATDDYDNYSGTSMSTPNVTGSLLLVQEHCYNTFGGFMRAATLKALAIHTADEAGAAGGPDYRHGWGGLNTRKAVDLITIAGDEGDAGIFEDVLNNNASLSLQVTSDGAKPLRATIAWADPAGTANGTVLNPTQRKLINDLDLRATLGGTTFFPYTLNPASPGAAASNTLDNNRDNVEQIYIADPAPGVYTFTITHKGSLSGGSQPFSLIFSADTQSGSEDLCDQATPISCGNTVTYTTSGAEQDVPDCVTELNTAPGHWYKFSPTQTSIVTATTCNVGTNFDTKIGVFSGTCSNLVCVTGDDDDDDCSDDTHTTVEFTASAGQTYYIYVTGFSDDAGTYQLSLTCADPCPVPTGLAATATNYAHVALNWNAVSGATGYETRYRIGAGAWTDGIIFSSPGASWGNLQPNTQHEFQVRAECGALTYSDWSASIFVTTLGAGDPYCYSYGLTWDDWIAGVSMANLNNTSGKNYGYGPYTSLTANVQRGNSYNIALTPATDDNPETVYWRVWIDFNKDNDFLDTGEQVFEATGTNAAAVNGSIAIPANAPTGVTRMRVSMSLGAYAAPCQANEYREVEDYSVNISNAVQAPVANFSASATCGQAPLAVNFTDLSTNNPVAWSWNFGNGQTSAQQNPSYTYTQPGTYTVTLSATNAGGADLEEKIAYITVVGAVSISASPGNQACAGTPIQLQAAGAAQYTWSGPGLNANAGPLVTAQPVVPGAYTYTATGSTNNCAAAPATISLTFNAVPAVTATASSNAACVGSAVTLTASGASAYTWTGPGLSANAGAQVTAQPSAPGAYTYQATGSSNGCSATSQPVTIQFNAAPVVTASASTDTACLGIAVTLTASGAATYTWTGPGLSASSGALVTAQPASAGAYTYQVTGSANGCVALPQQVAVQIIPVPVVTIVPSSETACLGDAVTLTASGAGAYSWAGAGLNAASGAQVTAQPALPGSYAYLVIGSAGGCNSAPQSATIQFFPPPVVTLSASSNAACAGASIVLTAAGASDYSWSGQGLSATTGPQVSAQPAIPGAYTYQVTGTANGCAGAPQTKTLTFNPIPSIVLTASSAAICAGETVIFSASGAETYAWTGPGLASNTGSTVTAAPTVPGSYVYLATGASNGCVSDPQSLSLQVSAPNVPAVTIAAEGCPGPNLNFTATVANAGPAPNILWYRNGQPVWSGPAYTLFSAINGDTVYCVATPVNPPPCTQPGAVASDVFVVNCIPLATSLPEGLRSVALFPNPNDGHFRLLLELDRPWSGNIRIFNALGQEIYTEPAFFSGHAQVWPVRLPGAVPGHYWLVMQSDAGIYRAGFEVR